MKLAFIDIGELGWSLPFSARIRWIKRNTDHSIAVFVYPDRRGLYTDLADIILDVPKDFYTNFDVRPQSCFGLLSALGDTVMAFFQPYIPEDYTFAEEEVPSPKTEFKNRLIFEPYSYSKKLEGGKEILVFPRHRSGENYNLRNLPEVVYVFLINKLCDEFTELTIRTIGTFEGAYNIQIEKPNYVNWVGKGESIQDLIDRCQLAVAAVGAQSAPPKISLLQGVPTFMIGHDSERHMIKDNWLRTKAGFYSIPKNGYATINQEDCTNKIIEFIRSCV